jgi:pimeloyl-ACP methyl ester carboxylesterase
MADGSPVESRGFSIDYTSMGDGPSVLLVGGLSMWAEQWTDHADVDALTACGCRVIIVDPLGHGDSHKPHDADRYASHAIAADLVAVLDAEGIESAVGWGFSLGVSYAVALAAVAPDRITGVVCASGGPQ